MTATTPLPRTLDATRDRLHHELAAVSNRETADAVIDRLDLGTSFGAEVLLGAVLRTAWASAGATRPTDGAAREDEASHGAVVVRVGEHLLREPRSTRGHGHHSSEPVGIDADAMAKVLARAPRGTLVTAEHTSGDAVSTAWAWTLSGGWAWPARTAGHGEVGGADHTAAPGHTMSEPQPGAPLWRVALEDQLDEQNRTNRAVQVGAAVLRGVLAHVPNGEATLHVFDTVGERTYTLAGGAGAAHLRAPGQELLAEESAVGAPVAFGSGAVTLLLSTSDAGAGAGAGATMQAWRVEPSGVVALDERELKEEFAPRWFDRHRGMHYLSAPPLELP